jgi:Na+/H+-dicarboxylate symporter
MSEREGSAAEAPRVPLWLQLVLALAAGAAVGGIVGPPAAALGELALLFVRLLKLLATPLAFFAIVDTFVSTRLPLKRALLLLPLSTLNAVVAAAIALGVAHALPVGRFVELPRLRALVAAPTPPAHPLLNFINKLLERPLAINLLWVIAAALVVGLSLRALEQRPAVAVGIAAAGRFAHAALRLLMRALALVVRAVPLAAFGIMARVVGTSGLSIFPVLGLFVVLVTLGIGLHIFAWYALLLRVLGRVRPGPFFRLGADALGTAMAAGSSLATLPVTLRTLEERMHVSSESARLAAVVGTNLNHDGIILYEAVAALFVAQIYGLDLSFTQELHIVGMSVLAAIGIAGVPEAGLVTLSLVLSAVGLPLAAVPLLLPVDWLLGRLRATANVTSDLVVATLLDALSTSKRRA